jgi:hypothetical protein
MSLLKLQEKDRRLVILRLLAEQPDYAVNSSVMQTALVDFGHKNSRDTINADYHWLKDQSLVTLTDIEGVVLTATLTLRGQDVANGNATHPGVQRPSPSDL